MTTRSNSSLEKLVSNLRKEEGVGLLFHSDYFGVDIPVKNIIIACTSNCILPGDENYLLHASERGSELFGYFGYGRVEYITEVFDEVWVRRKVGKEYLKELERRLPHCGRDIWKYISESDKVDLKGAMLNLREAFDKQVGQSNVRGNVARREVSGFIAGGGEDEWLDHDNGK